jgi:pyridoxal phosphate enzyme (YggS family)
MEQTEPEHQNLARLKALPPGVKLMAVTKGHSIEEILPVLEQFKPAIIGESRWQEAKTKLQYLPQGIEKHFIGHLQTNKVSEAIAAFEVIESVDSEKLLLALDTAGKNQQKVVSIFLQVNISHDPAKFGFQATALKQVIARSINLSNISIKGLMAITAKQSLEATRIDFKQLKQLQLNYHLPELSMGMSTDWEVAVEEGATIIRVGRGLFDIPNSTLDKNMNL